MVDGKLSLAGGHARKKEMEARLKRANWLLMCSKVSGKGQFNILQKIF